MYEAICKAIFEQYGMEVQETQNLKGGIVKTGITPATGDIRPTVYPDQLPEGSPEEVAATVYKLLNEHQRPDISTENLTDWEYAKDHLQLCVRPVTNYPGHVVKPFLDLELYVRVRLSETASCVVTDGLLERWGISAEDLFTATPQPSAVAKNFFTGLDDVKPEDAQLGAAMIVLSAAQTAHGAAAMLDTATLDIIAEHNGGRFYVIPSSIHECILLPYGAPVNELKAMVQAVNSTEVMPEEKLSDSVYLYENGSLKIAA